MTYDHKNQYRCTIVRGKALNDLDNLLPTYAQIIDDICPCSDEDFRSGFNSKLAGYLAISTEKTLNNHRTEIAGKLFGMYFMDSNEIVYPSPRTLKLLEDADQPAFFKDLILKYQFPSGMSKMNTVIEQLDAGIGVRQLSVAMCTIFEASKLSMNLTKKELGYYVLNSFDVLSGSANTEEILAQIIEDRKNSISREISVPGKELSYNYQHINEQINLLMLANLIYVHGDEIIINRGEAKYIEYLISFCHQPPEFDFNKYRLDELEQRKKANFEWDMFFATPTNIDDDKIISTEPSSLVRTYSHSGRSTSVDTVALGDEGEEYVYNIERNRVEKFNPRLVGKIKKVGKIKGLGYDIQSVFADGDDPEFAKYIEVKSTKRVTSPSDAFNDTVNLTRNEWIAAKQHGAAFFVYRVYFCQEEVKIFVIEDPYNLNDKKVLRTIPLTYRMDFDQNAGAFEVV